MGTASQSNPISISSWLELGLILASLALITLRETFDFWVILGILLLLLFFVVRIMAGRVWPRGTGMEGPLALFVLSAAIATWISFDASTALLQFTRIIAAVALFTLISGGNPFFRRWLAAGFVTAAALLALYWPLQHDFSTAQGKFQLVDAIGSWIETNGLKFKLTGLTGPFIHPNVAAGTLALAIPFGAAFIIEGIKFRRLWISVLAAIGTVVLIFGLLLTGSRGTWASLACAAVIFLLAWIQRRWFASPVLTLAFWGLSLGIAFLLLAFLATSFDIQRVLGTIPGPSGSVQSRLDLWRQGSGLIRDYFFTGSGLGTFWMVHAFYSIVLHVPFIAHAHNTFLEVWIEQGLLGAAALLWGAIVVFTWYRRALDRKVIPVLGVAGLFSLASMAIHGMIDVVFYIERTLPLVGFVLGYAWLAVPDEEAIQSSRIPGRLTGRIIFFGGSLLLVMFMLLFPKIYLSRFYANLGALMQTRAELSLYDPANHYKLPVDKVRQQLDYTSISRFFGQALNLDPYNQTAIQRLSMIALSSGDYAAAWQAMQAVWQAHPGDITAQILYADAAVANGFPEEAAVALKSNPWAELHLMGNAWSRYWVEEDYQRALDSYQAVLILNPNNVDAQNQAALARQKLEQ